MSTKKKYRKIARFGKLTSSLSQWFEKTKDKVQLCEYVGKLKGVGQQAKVYIGIILIVSII